MVSFMPPPVTVDGITLQSSNGTISLKDAGTSPAKLSSAARGVRITARYPAFGAAAGQALAANQTWGGAVFGGTSFVSGGGDTNPGPLVFLEAGTIIGAWVELSANAAEATAVLKLRVNAADSAKSLTLLAAGTGTIPLAGGDVAIAAGDRVNITIALAPSGGVTVRGFLIQFVPT